MSAFLVHKSHITAILSGFAMFGYGKPTPADLTEKGQMLWRENDISVSYRYNDKPDDGYKSYKFPAAALVYPPSKDPVFYLKLIDCLEYQSCEHPDWEKSQACQFLNQLRRSLISKLPGYDSAPWAYDGPEPKNNVIAL